MSLSRIGKTFTAVGAFIGSLAVPANAELLEPNARKIAILTASANHSVRLVYETCATFIKEQKAPDQYGVFHYGDQKLGCDLVLDPTGKFAQQVNYRNGNIKHDIYNEKATPDNPENKLRITTTDSKQPLTTQKTITEQLSKTGCTILVEEGRDLGHLREVDSASTLNSVGLCKVLIDVDVSEESRKLACKVKPVSLPLCLQNARYPRFPFK